MNTSDTISCASNWAILSGEGSSTGSAIEYYWLDTTNDTIGNSLQQTVTEGGFYTLIVYSSYSGCSASSEIFVEDNTDYPIAEINSIGSQSITCQNNSVVLSGEGSGPLGEISFEWFYNGNFISGEVEIQVEQAGDYMLQIINFVNGCSAYDTITVEENMLLPDIDILTPPELNCIDTIIQIDASNSSTGSEFEYQWSSQSGNGILSGTNTLTPSVNLPGIYLLVIENTDNGCADSSSVTITANTELPLAEAGAAADLDCDNPTSFLNGTGSSIGSKFEYLWFGNGILNGGDSLTPEVNQTGVFTLLVTNTENGCTATDEVIIGGTTDFLSGAFIFVDDPDCQNENNGSIQIESEVGGIGPYMYSIEGQPFVQNNLFGGLSAGTYEITVMDATGCEWDTLVTLNVPGDVFVNLGEDILIPLGDSVQLTPQINIPFAQIDTFFWEHSDEDFCDTCFDQWVSPHQTSSYSITVFNEAGCRSVDEVVIRVEKNRLVYFPNAFSPNNDGNNDIFMIYGGKDVLRVNSFQIYNRWGGIVFEQMDFKPNNPQHGWDGTLRGQPLNPDVFVYFAEIEFIDGRVLQFKGDITLFK